MKTTLKVRHLLPLSALLPAFLVVPFTQLGMFALMPGDIGDARLNNYFLENATQFFVGGSNSLWHLSFFFPFPYVIGFSDNLFGSAPVYLLARLSGAGTDTAYQIWFFFGYIVNFVSAYYGLRRLQRSVVAATVGALIFAFALPTSAHAGHAQLHYRFGLPLAIVFFIDFINTKSWRYLIMAAAWLIWQFYSGIYMGFFTLLLLAAMSLTYCAVVLIGGQLSLKAALREFLSTWQAQSRKQKTVFLACSGGLLLLLVALFSPYLQVTNLYGGRRSWDEISSMLPRPQSYLLADASFLWSHQGAKLFDGIPMRHEHQMFFGVIPLLLGVAGFITGARQKYGQTFTLIAGMFGVAIVSTLYIGGFSLWYFLHWLPLASAIRAITRLDQAFLFPVAYFACITVDEFKRRYTSSGKAALGVVVLMLVAEAAMTSMPTSSKESWRQRLASLDASVPQDLPDDAVLFFAQNAGPAFAHELDAMWVALRQGKNTLNGYSGILPPGYESEFGRDCAQLPRRVLAYVYFARQSDYESAYRELMSRIVPVGFDGCESTWWHMLPNITGTRQVYSEHEFKYLSFGIGEIEEEGNQPVAHVEIKNASSHSFSAFSLVGRPIRISWRFMDVNGQPTAGWDTRKDLPLDIPAQGTLDIRWPLDPVQMANAKAVQISLVQERVFWGHDIGVQPRTIPVK